MLCSTHSQRASILVWIQTFWDHPVRNRRGCSISQRTRFHGYGTDCWQFGRSLSESWAQKAVSARGCYSNSLVIKMLQPLLSVTPLDVQSMQVNVHCLVEWSAQNDFVFVATLNHTKKSSVSASTQQEWKTHRNQEDGWNQKYIPEEGAESRLSRQSWIKSSPGSFIEPACCFSSHHTKDQCQEASFFSSEKLAGYHFVLVSPDCSGYRWVPVNSKLTIAFLSNKPDFKSDEPESFFFLAWNVGHGQGRFWVVAEHDKCCSE